MSSNQIGLCADGGKRGSGKRYISARHRNHCQHVYHLIDPGPLVLPIIGFFQILSPLAKHLCTKIFQGDILRQLGMVNVLPNSDSLSVLT